MLPAHSLRVMTYNVHGCLGLDRVRSVERIAEVLLHYNPDIVALQEVDVHAAVDNSVDQASALSELSGYQMHFSPTRANEKGQFGNVILCKRPFELVGEGTLPVRFGEARAAHRLRIPLDEDTAIDLVNTHLSIHFFERLPQIRALLSDDALLEPHGITADEVKSNADEVVLPQLSFSPIRGPTDLLILCGDLNAGSWSPVYRWFLKRLHDVQRGRTTRALSTWPSRLPLLRLDHIWLGRRLGVDAVIVPKTTLTQVASDHLPLIADLRILQPEMISVP